MAYDPFSFPQDAATGLQDTIDWNDAGGFAWLSHHPNTTGHVIEGFELEPDYSNDLFTIRGGVAELEQTTTWTNDHTDDGGEPEIEVGHATFRAQRGPSVDRELASGTNYVYLYLDQSANNRVLFQDNTTQTPPSEPYILLGTIDTGSQSVVYHNQHSTQTAEKMLITEEK